MALAREIEGFRVLASSLLRDPGAHIAAPSSSSLYRELGKAWQASVGVVEALSGDEVHVPEEGHSVEEDVLDALVTATQEVWASVKPKINGVTVPQRISSITKAYRLFRAAASAAPGGQPDGRAADRAALAGLGVPTYVPMTPGAGGPSPAGGSWRDDLVRRGVGDGGFHSPREQGEEGGEQGTGQGGGIDLVEALLGRMDGAGASQVPKPGKGAGETPAKRSAGVSPPLARAASRLITVGVPPLRVQRQGQALLSNILLNSDSGTFTGWVNKQAKLSGAQLREALSTARAMDLATMELGTVYLVTSAAEVQARRLLSITIFSKTNSWKLAAVLEEVPTEGMLPELPEDMVTAMCSRLKAWDKLGLDP